MTKMSREDVLSELATLGIDAPPFIKNLYDLRSLLHDARALSTGELVKLRQQLAPEAELKRSERAARNVRVSTEPRRSRKPEDHSRPAEDLPEPSSQALPDRRTTAERADSKSGAASTSTTAEDIAIGLAKLRDLADQQRHTKSRVPRQAKTSHKTGFLERLSDAAEGKSRRAEDGPFGDDSGSEGEEDLIRALAFGREPASRSSTRRPVDRLVANKGGQAKKTSSNKGSATKDDKGAGANKAAGASGP